MTAQGMSGWLQLDRLEPGTLVPAGAVDFALSQASPETEVLDGREALARLARLPRRRRRERRHRRPVERRLANPAARRAARTAARLEARYPIHP